MDSASHAVLTISQLVTSPAAYYTPSIFANDDEKRKRRPLTACGSCRRRKIRCDLPPATTADTPDLATAACVQCVRDSQICGFPRDIIKRRVERRSRAEVLEAQMLVMGRKLKQLTTLNQQLQQESAATANFYGNIRASEPITAAQAYPLPSYLDIPTSLMSRLPSFASNPCPFPGLEDPSLSIMPCAEAQAMTTQASDLDVVDADGLPPSHIICALLDPSLLQHVIGIWPIIHPPTFAANLSRGEIPKYLLCALLAFASDHYHIFEDANRAEAASIVGDFSTRVRMSDRLALQARQGLVGAGTAGPTPCVEMVQALLALSGHSLARGSIQQAYHDHGAALRVSLDLALNRADDPSYFVCSLQPPRTLSAVDLETRRQLFWTAYISEAMSSFATGRPIACDPKDCLGRLRLPVASAFWLNAPPGMNAIPLGPMCERLECLDVDELANMSELGWMALLSVVNAVVMRHAAVALSPNTVATGAVWISEYLLHDAELVQFYRLVPPHRKVNPDDPICLASASHDVVLLHVYYHASLLHLHQMLFNRYRLLPNAFSQNSPAETAQLLAFAMDRIRVASDAITNVLWRRHPLGGSTANHDDFHSSFCIFACYKAATGNFILTHSAPSAASIAAPTVPKQVFPHEAVPNAVTEPEAIWRLMQAKRCREMMQAATRAWPDGLKKAASLEWVGHCQMLPRDECGHGSQAAVASLGPAIAWGSDDMTRCGYALEDGADNGTNQQQRGPALNLNYPNIARDATSVHFSEIRTPSSHDFNSNWAIQASVVARPLDGMQSSSSHPDTPPVDSHLALNHSRTPSQSGSKSMDTHDTVQLSSSTTMESAEIISELDAAIGHGAEKCQQDCTPVRLV